MNFGSCVWEGLRVTRPPLESAGETRWREIQLASTIGLRGWVKLVDLHSKWQHFGLNCSRRGGCRIRSLSERLGRGDSGLKMSTASYGLDLVARARSFVNRAKGINPESYVSRCKVASMLDRKYAFWSVVIPTYNRLPILTKCLEALEEQRGHSACGIQDFEVIVVDDGSTDETVEFLKCSRCKKSSNASDNNAISKLNGTSLEARDTNGHRNEGIESESDWLSMAGEGEAAATRIRWSERFPHVKVVEQTHKGATAARNLGLQYARGGVIVFIDSDLVVTETFLQAHGEALRDAFLEDGGDDRAFTYGRVVNTSNFHDPTSERFKLTDYSAAFFATGNVAISHQRLLKAGELLGKRGTGGPFDSRFSEYGWEDLELGVRLKQCGARTKHAPAAIGYHWHPAFSVEQLPKLIEQEKQRGRNGVHFHRKHPTLDVRLMVQMTPFHEALWFLLTLGGVINERTLQPILDALVKAGRHRTAAALVSPVLNWHTVQAMKEECRRLRDK